MTHKEILRPALGLLFCISMTAFPNAQPSQAQGTGGPLTIHGLHQHTMHSAAARGFGGVTVGIRNDVSLMFQNPASLQSLNGIQIAFGGINRSLEQRQVQEFAPVRYFPNLSLLLENRTDAIPDPDPELFGFNPQDTVQRPFDNIDPRWTHSHSQALPLQAMVAAPFSAGNINVIAGVGFVEYGNLNHFYQNYNVLSPNVLSMRPVPVPRPTGDQPVTVDWSQTMRSREGTIHGYGAAVAGHLPEHNISIGFSGLFLDGQSDDFEQEMARGQLTFFANAFRLDPAQAGVTRTGTSTYSGQEFTLSSMIEGQYASLGFSIKAPTTITRSYTMDVTTDSGGTPSTSSVPVSGEDRLELPWRGTVGLSLAPRENLRLGIEYEFRPYGTATYSNGGTETSPWVSASLFGVGGEYDLTPWLALRGGMRGESEYFVPDGSALEDAPVTYTVYSAGVGATFSGIRLNLTYENANINYQDIWGSALSRNYASRHVVVADVAYTIPWGR